MTSRPDDVDAEALRVVELARRAGAVADGTAELIDTETFVVGSLHDCAKLKRGESSIA